MGIGFREFLAESDTSELDIRVKDVITLTSDYNYTVATDTTIKLPKGSKYKITRIEPDGNNTAIYMRIVDEKVLQLYNKLWDSNIYDVDRNELLFFTIDSRLVDNKFSKLKYTVDGAKSLKINFTIKYKGVLSKEDIIELLTNSYKNITDIKY